MKDEFGHVCRTCKYRDKRDPEPQWRDKEGSYFFSRSSWHFDNARYCSCNHAGVTSQFPLGSLFIIRSDGITTTLGVQLVEQLRQANIITISKSLVKVLHPLFMGAFLFFLLQPIGEDQTCKRD